MLVELTEDEITVIKLMITSFVECDEDYILSDLKQEDRDEVTREIEILKSLSEKLP